MDLTQTIVVYSAGVIGAITSFPQLYQIVKTEKVRDINPYFFILHVLSDVLYLSYGILTKDTLLAISMSLPSVCNAAIFGLCIYYKEKDKLKDDTITNCDICCKDVETIGKNYCVFKRGNKQELWSCEECWEENKDKLTEELWSWTCYDEDGNIISFLPKTDSSISIDRKESSDNLIEN
jgi:uncharacterized protein with PQ loop repeat